MTSGPHVSPEPWCLSLKGVLVETSAFPVVTAAAYLDLLLCSPKSGCKFKESLRPRSQIYCMHQSLQCVIVRAGLLNRAPK